jgi:sugar lactone lactonase YvrE
MAPLQSNPAPESRATSPERLFLLDLSGRIYALNPDGSDRRIIVTDVVHPDGVVVDATAGHIYWTNMGVPALDDGSIERADFDGGNRAVVVPPGVTHTPKQIHLERASGKLYWCDREGMRVMRCDLDGSHVETLLAAGRDDADRLDQTRWCVGVTVDRQAGKFYWTQKGPDNAGRGRIFRAGLEIPAGETPADRSDIEVLFDGLPEPIDLEFDPATRRLYWTDRGDPPRGDTLNRAPVDHPSEPEILATHLMEGIGLALDLAGNRMFVTDLGGSLYAADLDGKGWRSLLTVQGNLSGVAYVGHRTQEH